MCSVDTISDIHTFVTHLLQHLLYYFVYLRTLTLRFYFVWYLCNLNYNDRLCVTACHVTSLFMMYLLYPESAWRPDVSVTGGVYVTERHSSGCGAAGAGNTAHCMGAGACVTP